jgi:hypothetical protein
LPVLCGLVIDIPCLLHQVATLRKSLSDSKDDRILKALADLGEDNEGNIDVAELLQCVDRAAKHQDMVQQLKWVAGAGLVFVLLMSLAVFGVSWGVVALTRETSTAVRHQTLCRPKNRHSARAPYSKTTETSSSLAPHLPQRSGVTMAFVDKGSGQTLRIAAATVLVHTFLNDPDEVLSAYANATAATSGRRLTLSSALAPEKTLAYAFSIATTGVDQVCACISMLGGEGWIKRMGSSQEHLPV